MAVLAQFGNVRQGVHTLTEEQLARPARLGEWSVRELAAHLTMAVETVSRNLDRPEPGAKEVALLDWPFATAARAGDIADGTRELARDNPDLDALYARVEQRITERLATAPDDRLLAARTGAMTLADYLVTRTVELVVHTDDLNRAVAPTSPSTDRPSPPAPGCSPTRSP